MSGGHGHRSSTSQHSRSASQFLNDTDELTDAELIKQVNDIKQQIKVLKLENEIFEKVILRLEPALMHGVQQALEYAVRLQSSSSLNMGSFVKSKTSAFGLVESMISPSKMLASPSKVSTRRVESSAKIGGTIIFGTGPRINVLERSELVSTEMEILVTTLKKIRLKAAKQHALLKAQLEEIGVRLADFDKATDMFNQSVIVEGWDKIAQRIPAEIWIRFMTEWVKICDSQIGKLRLRTSTLNTQYSKLKGQIKAKTELSESLRPVDFEKLKIENSECVALIEKKLLQLEELKKMTAELYYKSEWGKINTSTNASLNVKEEISYLWKKQEKQGDANLTLTMHKKSMMEQNNYLANVLKTTKSKETQMVELGKERDVITVQADSLALRLEDVRKVRIQYEVPDIMDYVTVKSEVTELKRSIKMLENRVHIQQIALTSINKKLHTMYINN